MTNLWPSGNEVRDEAIRKLAAELSASGLTDYAKGYQEAAARFDALCSEGTFDLEADEWNGALAELASRGRQVEDAEFSEVTAVTVTAVQEQPPNFTRDEAQALVRALRDELFAQRRNVTELERDLLAAEADARQKAVDFDHGGRKLTRDELVQIEIKNHQEQRRLNPEGTGNGTAFLRKQMQYGRNRVPTVPDGKGGQTLARLPDGSYPKMNRGRTNYSLVNRKPAPVTR
jgi:hypothetical protein